MNVSNKMLINAAKFQGYSFYRFWVITGKPTGGVKYPPPPRPPLPTQIRVKFNIKSLFIRNFPETIMLAGIASRTNNTISPPVIFWFSLKGEIKGINFELPLEQAFMFRLISYWNIKLLVAGSGNRYLFLIYR